MRDGGRSGDGVCVCGYGGMVQCRCGVGWGEGARVCGCGCARGCGCGCVVLKCGCGGLAWRREHIGVGVDNAGVNVGVAGDVNVGELCGGGVSA